MHAPTGASETGSLLDDRKAGLLSPQSFIRSYTLRLALQLGPAPGIHFNGNDTLNRSAAASRLFHSALPLRERTAPVAHITGTNCLTVDPLEGRLLLSGGANGSIKLWDLQACSSPPPPHSTPSAHTTLTPHGAVPSSPTTHTHGITHLSFYPFDTLAFLSSSYDHTLKLFSSTTLTPSATFNLNSAPITTHSISPIASHLLVACATESPAIKLVDLRSGGSGASLLAHKGVVLSLAWSPTRENVLASAGADGGVRLWDVRGGSRGCLAALDMSDVTGAGGIERRAHDPNPASRGAGAGAGVAHSAAANGVAWTSDGHHLVSCGLDEQIRVWDALGGANALCTYGPAIRNTRQVQRRPMLLPVDMVPAGKALMVWPNAHEILLLEVFSGRLLRRMEVPGVEKQGANKSRLGGITGLAGRVGDVQLFTSEAHGRIVVWTPGDEGVEEEAEGLAAVDEGDGGLDASERVKRKRKREALDDVFHDLMKRPITFA